MKIEAIRHHDFSAGHRVVGHENKCRYLHGHNYRAYFYCSGKHLDHIGRVIDFGIIKSILCDWVEVHWDHKMLIWEQDPLLSLMMKEPLLESIEQVPFNPTAENMAQYLLTQAGPILLADTDVILHKVIIEETRKCSATASL